MNHPLRLLQTFLLALLLGSLVSELSAQEPESLRKVLLPSLDSQVRARLAALDRRLQTIYSPSVATGLTAHLSLPSPSIGSLAPFLGNERNEEMWDQLAEEYYRLMLESGEALILQSTSPGGAGSTWSYGLTRQLCHQRLASLPRSSLEVYRQRVDVQARVLFEQGRRTRSELPLRRVVDELFCSSAGEEALDLLGDLAFEQGHFSEARHWWSMLIPLDAHRNTAGGRRLLFPDPKIDLVRIRAKQILALIFAGRLDEAQDEIARFQERYPLARGLLAGQQDTYAKILLKTLGSFARERVTNNEEPWTTFGGDPTRNRLLTQGLPWSLWEDGPAWTVKLPTPNAGNKPDRRISRRPAFHPVVVQNQILIADHRSVVSYHLQTGKELFHLTLAMMGLNDMPIGMSSKSTVPRFSLTVDHDRAYVRLGQQAFGLKEEIDKECQSYLVCLDLTQPEQKKQRVLWHAKANDDAKTPIPMMFEGAPLVHEGRVYVALSKIVDRRVNTSIVCYDKFGRQRWSREVCECPEFEEANSPPRYRQHLLTWAGGQLAYCSHAGTIVAVDAWTGQPTWSIRYVSRGPVMLDGGPSPRDLTPCVYADGRVFAAPLDTDRLFCMDAITGQLCWELENIEVVHLLGVAHGRLFVTTSDGLQAVDVVTGQSDWIQPTEGRLPSLGRGLLAGSWLFWPTMDAQLPYRAVTLREGQQLSNEDNGVMPEPRLYEPTMLSTLPIGNLAFGQGCLVIAGLDELAVFVPASKQLRPFPLEARPQASAKFGGLFTFGARISPLAR